MREQSARRPLPLLARRGTRGTGGEYPGHQSKPKPGWFYCKLAIPILAMLGQDLAKGVWVSD